MELIASCPNRVKIVFFVILWGSTISLPAQTDIRLAPGFGLQAFQSYVKDDVDASEGFGAYNLYFVPAYQVGLEVDVKRNWLFSMSVKSFRPSIAFKYGDPGAGGILQILASCTSLAAGAEKRISTHSWIKIKPAKKKNQKGNQAESGSSGQRYLLLFRLKAVGGISRDWVANYPGNEGFGTTNTSLFLGMGLQFFDRGKDRVKLSFIYSHGLREIADWDVTYVTAGTYYGKVASKGSFFAVQASYPIRLITIDGRKGS